MASLLMDEEFVAVFPSLVRRLGGMNRAAVLQAIHFASQVQGLEVDGRIWTPLTAAQIGRKTGLSDDSVQRALSALTASGVLKGRGAQQGTRRLMWTIVHEVLEPSRGTAEPTTAESRNDLRETAESSTTKNLKKSPNNVSPISIGNASIVAQRFVDKFRAAHDNDPDRASIGRVARDAKRMLAEGRPLEMVIAAAELCALRGHANLPSGLTSLLAQTTREPRGFAGIREFLDAERNDEPK